MVSDTKIVNILQEDGVSEHLQFRHGPKINDAFPTRIWVYSINFSTAIASIQISEPDLEEWIDLPFPNGDFIVNTNSSFVIYLPSDCDLRWKVDNISITPIDPESLPEDERNKIESYPEGAVKVGIEFR